MKRMKLLHQPGPPHELEVWLFDNYADDMTEGDELFIKNILWEELCGDDSRTWYIGQLSDAVWEEVAGEREV